MKRADGQGERKVLACGLAALRLVIARTSRHDVGCAHTEVCPVVFRVKLQAVAKTRQGAIDTHRSLLDRFPQILVALLHQVRGSPSLAARTLFRTDCGRNACAREHGATGYSQR